MTGHHCGMIGPERYYDWVVTMPIHLHKHATTASKAPDPMEVHRTAEENLRPRFGTKEQSLDQLPHQDALEGRSPMAKQMHTTLMLSQKAAALHASLLIWFHHALELVHECLNPTGSSYRLEYRIWRHRVAHRRDLEMNALRVARSCSELTAFRDVHVKSKPENKRADRFVRPPLPLAIEHVAVWIFARLSNIKKTAYALHFLLDIDRADIVRTRTVLHVTREELKGRLTVLSQRPATSGQPLYTPWSTPKLTHNLEPHKSLQNNNLLPKLSGRDEQVIRSHQLRLGTTSRRCFTATLSSKIDTSHDHLGTYNVLNARDALILPQTTFRNLVRYLPTSPRTCAAETHE